MARKAEGGKTAPKKGAEAAKKSSSSKQPSKAKKPSVGERSASTAKNTKKPVKEAAESNKAATKAANKARPAPKATPAADTGAVGDVIFLLQSGSPVFVKTDAICKATGKTNQWIGQLTSQGVISKTKTGHGSLYSLYDTMRNYCAYLEKRAKDKEAPDDVKKLDMRRKSADAKLKEAKATVAELEAAEFQGKMHRSEDVQAMTADLLFCVRGALLAVAGRCATDCAASDNPAEVQKIIQREVYAVLKELTEYEYDPKRYKELVDRRMKREIEESSDDNEE